MALPGEFRNEKVTSVEEAVLNLSLPNIVCISPWLVGLSSTPWLGA
jgi:hypothetical protein